MAKVIPKPHRSGKNGNEPELAEVFAAFAKATSLYRRYLKRHQSHSRNRIIPTYGCVKIVAPPAEFDDLSGEDGVVLGGGKLPDGERTYTVLVPVKNQTYYLSHSALEFTGSTVRETDIYSGDSIRVASVTS